MATEIPSHNLNEVAQRRDRDDPRSRARASPGLMKHIKGPDFPGRRTDHHAARGAQGRLHERARLGARARALDHRAPGARSVAGGGARAAARNLGAQGAAKRSTRSPIRSRKAGQEIAHARAEREKQLMLSMLDKERDESDRTHPVRLVFEPKTSRIDETEFVNLLLAKTSLETQRADQPGDGRPGRASHRQESARHRVRVGAVPLHDGDAPHAAPARPGARPHPRARRAHDRPAQRGQGDQDHPQCRRCPRPI